MRWPAIAAVRIRSRARIMRSAVVRGTGGRGGACGVSKGRAGAGAGPGGRTIGAGAIRKSGDGAGRGLFSGLVIVERPSSEGATIDKESASLTGYLSRYVTSWWQGLSWMSDPQRGPRAASARSPEGVLGH